jgi:hypothetical protein
VYEDDVYAHHTERKCARTEGITAPAVLAGAATGTVHTSDFIDQEFGTFVATETSGLGERSGIVEQSVQTDRVGFGARGRPYFAGGMLLSCAHCPCPLPLGIDRQ